MAKKFENPAEFVESAQLVESAQTAMADLQRREEIEALTRAVKILYDYGPAFKEFPNIAQNLIDEFNGLVDVFQEGVKPSPKFGKMVSEHLFSTLTSIKQDIANEQTSFRTDLSEERTAFTQEMAKLHEAQLDFIRATHRRNLADLDRKDSRIAVPPYVIYVVMTLLLLLAIHFGATLIAILTDTPTGRLATITVIFLAFIILLPALIIYLHRQEYL